MVTGTSRYQRSFKQQGRVTAIQTCQKMGYRKVISSLLRSENHLRITRLTDTAEKQSDQGLQCLPIRLHLSEGEALSYGEITLFRFWDDYRKCLEYQRKLSQRLRLWYLSHRRPAKAQVSLRIRAVSPEPLLFAYMKYGSRRRI